MSGKKIFFNISVRFQRTYLIALFACLAAVLLYSLLFLIVPFQSYLSGLVMAIVISILIGFGLGHLVIAFNREMKRQVKINKANDEVKAQLIYILSHDIKGPLFNIKHLLGMAQDKNIDLAELQQLCKQLQEDTENTLLLTRNLVKWIQTKEDNYEPSINRHNISALVQETCELYVSIGKSKNIAIDIVGDGSVEINTDGEMYKIVLRNLLSNAIKFSQENTSVEVGYKVNNSNLVTWVQDSGTGISQSKLEKIFSESGIVESELGTKDEIGTGIGLQLSKNVAKKLNGELWAESNKNKGTCFYFSLPIKTSH